MSSFGHAHAGAAVDPGVGDRLRPGRITDAGRGRAADAQGDLRDARVGVRRALANQCRRRRPAVRRNLALVVHAARRIRSHYRGGGLQAGHRAARTGVEHGGAGVDSRRRRRCQLPPGAGRRPGRPARRVRISDPARHAPCWRSWSSSRAKCVSRIRISSACWRRSGARSACSSIASAPKRSSIASSPSPSISSASRPSTATSRA